MFNVRICSRRGHSLVEMLVVISVMSVMFSGLAVALHGMYRADTLARRDLESSVNFAHLAGRFRTDVHAAAAADAKDAALVLTLADERTITYEFGGKRVVRMVRRQDKVEHRDSFRFTSDSSVAWEVGKEESMPTVSLIVERSEAKRSRIEARLGSDHRFEKRESP